MSYKNAANCMFIRKSIVMQKFRIVVTKVTNIYFRIYGMDFATFTGADTDWDSYPADSHSLSHFFGGHIKRQLCQNHPTMNHSDLHTAGTRNSVSAICRHPVEVLFLCTEQNPSASEIFMLIFTWFRPVGFFKDVSNWNLIYDNQSLWIVRIGYILKTKYISLLNLTI